MLLLAASTHAWKIPCRATSVTVSLTRLTHSFTSSSQSLLSTRAKDTALGPTRLSEVRTPRAQVANWRSRLLTRVDSDKSVLRFHADQVSWRA